ncbi:hypothetical protein ACFOY8_14705 [Thalassospira xianhensis]|uniref:Uncharacterized protein n=1 Tax=Thalassospira xianhensis MCCC 1A02616 TaxID=1177929 RepID=A0A367UHV6_9PROT|nr:hypothetical protein [Thalassospira xianhensis]RCK07600.1 hypothetical protein TH5_00530 [Thalassospira xianhensis MCCC 1A02616]
MLQHLAGYFYRAPYSEGDEKSGEIKFSMLDPKEVTVPEEDVVHVGTLTHIGGIHELTKDYVSKVIEWDGRLYVEPSPMEIVGMARLCLLYVERLFGQRSTKISDKQLWALQSKLKRAVDCVVPSSFDEALAHFGPGINAFFEALSQEEQSLDITRSGASGSLDPKPHLSWFSDINYQLEQIARKGEGILPLGNDAMKRKAWWEEKTKNHIIRSNGKVYYYVEEFVVGYTREGYADSFPSDRLRCHYRSYADAVRGCLASQRPKSVLSPFDGSDLVDMRGYSYLPPKGWPKLPLKPCQMVTRLELSKSYPSTVRKRLYEEAIIHLLNAATKISMLSYTDGVFPTDLIKDWDALMAFRKGEEKVRGYEDIYSILKENVSRLSRFSDSQNRENREAIRRFSSFMNNLSIRENYLKEATEKGEVA